MARIRFIEDFIFKGEDERGVWKDGCLYREDLSPGDAHWGVFEDVVKQLAFSCPCGCKVVGNVPVYLGDTGYGWKWDGNRESPTLSPSIQMLTPCRWHGHLIAGEFRRA